MFETGALEQLHGTLKKTRIRVWILAEFTTCLARKKFRAFLVS